MPNRDPRRRVLTVLVVVVAAVVVALVWLVGGPGLNAYAATHGHGTAGTFRPTQNRCETYKGHRTCEWHGTFVADDRSVVLDDVRMRTSHGAGPVRGYYAHVVPGTVSAVYSRTADWLAPVLTLAFIVVSLGVVGGALTRRHLRAVRAGLPFDPYAPARRPSSSRY